MDERKIKDTALRYMETLVEVARESFLILDHNLRVISANNVFYTNFQVVPEQTINRSLYDLGNGQWNIHELKILLEEILPKKKTIRDYEVDHTFETIGKKMILLNARQIDHTGLIILAIEDITVRKELEERLARYARDLEAKIVERTTELKLKISDLEKMNKIMVDRELKMIELKKEITNLKQQIK